MMLDASIIIIIIFFFFFTKIECSLLFIYIMLFFRVWLLSGVEIRRKSIQNFQLVGILLSSS